MPFQPHQVGKLQFRKSDTEWVSWKQLVAETKRNHDRGPGGYPLEIQLHDSDGKLLRRQKFAYVHDRTPESETKAPSVPFDAPLIYSVIKPQITPTEEPPQEFFIEAVRAPDMGRQMQISEIEKDE
jgi:hypothetical protein